MDRRNFMRASGAAALAGLSGAPMIARAEGKPLRAALGWINNVEYAGVWMGLENGYFKDEGIDLKTIMGGPNAPPPPVTLASGNTDIAFTAWLPLLDAVIRGNDFVLIGGTYPVSPLGILSLPGKPIKSAADIVGKKILAQGPNERTAIDATLALNNLPKQWEFVPAGFSPEPLLAKAGDGYTAFGTNQAVTLEVKMGMVRDKDFFFTSFDSMGFKSYTDIAFCKRDLLKSDRATVVKFMRALTKGWAADLKDPGVAAKLCVEKYGADLGLDLKQQTRQNELQYQMLKNPAKPAEKLMVLDRDLIAGPMYAAAKATGRENLPDVDKLCDFSIMEEVNASLK